MPVAYKKCTFMLCFRIKKCQKPICPCPYWLSLIKMSLINHNVCKGERRGRWGESKSGRLQIFWVAHLLRASMLQSRILLVRRPDCKASLYRFPLTHGFMEKHKVYVTLSKSSYRLMWNRWGLAKVSYKLIVILTDNFPYKKVLFVTDMSYYPIFNVSM